MPGKSSRERAAVVSPTPSLRHISQTRVNHIGNSPSSQASGMSPSPSGDYSDYMTMQEGEPSVNMELPLSHSNDQADVESIIYKLSRNIYQGRPHRPSHLSHQISFGSVGEQLRLLPPSKTNSFPNKFPGLMNITSNETTEYRNSSNSYEECTDTLDYSTLLPYYLPCLSWIPHYCVEFFLGDLLGGLSLVFFQLPLSLSYALSLAHVPVLCGLYSLAISPLIYMIFGSVPQMIVGPEAAISLIVGQAVEPLLHHATKKHPVDPTEVVVVITFISGASLLGFGLGRFGFLDNVLSASLLKGFISGVGIVMIINALIVMFGLSGLLDEVSSDPSVPDIHSPFDKFRFLLGNFKELHPLTFQISLVGFITVLLIRIFKKWYAKRCKRKINLVVYIPEILLVVICSTWCVSYFRLDKQGISIIGDVANDSKAKILHNPLAFRLWPLFKQVTTSGFLCAMLGFFESTTALKSLGSTYDLPISSNRELVALGFINIVAAMFGALPAFGGYGRSKINAISARTTMLGAIMGLCTFFTITCLMDYLHFIPKCTLNVVTCVIGILLIEEAPGELWFHWRSRGYNELITFGVTVTTTLFFSMESGIAVGLIYLLIRVIKHSAASRIQILGRIPGTNTFLNADSNIDQDGKIKEFERQLEAEVNDELRKSHINKSKSQLNFFTDNHFTQLNYQALEEIEGCLIVKIPEPLTFTNTNDLKSRLKRVEMYGSTKVHPGSKRTRDAAMTKYIIFDLNGMTEIDSSAVQILREILTNYEDRKIYCFFIRVNKDKYLRDRFDRTGITELLMRDLRDMSYFEVQNMQSILNDTSGKIDALDIYNLTESLQLPYFEHISDALKVIDYFETNNGERLDEV